MTKTEINIPARSGPYIQTHTGTRFHPVDPRHEDIHIEDIAHALGNICRFTGHTRSFYSVAQHSVLVSHSVPLEYALEALLHDASEAYLADIAKPVKSLYALRDYEKLENLVMLAISQKFGFEYPFHPIIKEADGRMLFTEKRDLLRVDLDWGYQLEPYPFEIQPLSPWLSQQLFLERFQILTATK